MHSIPYPLTVEDYCGMRGLTNQFVKELKSGLLEPILRLVEHDTTLGIEIRENYINVYYRGGNLLRIEEKGEAFKLWFDRNYLDEGTTRVGGDLPGVLGGGEDVARWMDVIPFLKHEMDLWFGRHPKNEREFQQLLLWENNVGDSAKGTDYFICDIEYANPEGRFDLVAVHWPSSAAARRSNAGLGLAFIEMKYMDKALRGKAGLRQHVEDMNSFLGAEDNLSNRREEMKRVFNQKLELGLIRNQKPIGSFDDDKPEYILVLANHDPGSSILKAELQSLPACPNLKLRFAVSSFMGYGLYNQNIFGLDVFLKRFSDQI